MKTQPRFRVSFEFTDELSGKTKGFGAKGKYHTITKQEVVNLLSCDSPVRFDKLRKLKLERIP